MRHLSKHHRQGKLLIKTFTEAFMLIRIHRSKDDRWWTESCLCLRDFACTKEDDWVYWRVHGLDRGHLDAAQKEYFEEEALWICARCQNVGESNGRKLAKAAMDLKRCIHQIKAVNSWQ